MIYPPTGSLKLQPATLSPQMTWTEAFETWLSMRIIDAGETMATNVRFISPRAVQDLRQYARAAGKYFGPMRLEDIQEANFREYQRARALHDTRYGDWKKPAGANLIRKEVGTVLRILRAAKLWNADQVKQLDRVQPADIDIPRAMSPQQQTMWLQTAGSRKEWRLVYWWSTVALQTTMSTNEMRSLRIGDISLEQGTLQVRSEGAKNKFRIRTIPLQTPEVLWALKSLIERAQILGAFDPESYLFPFHVTGIRYDPSRPMSVWGLRKAWDAIRAATGLRQLRIYDLRHTAITRMAEAGVPIQVIMSFAGHISPKMQEHYTAISMEAKRRWAAMAWGSAQMSPPMPRQIAAPTQPDWRQQAIAAGWTPGMPIPPSEAPAWQEHALAAGWAAPPQLHGPAINF